MTKYGEIYYESKEKIVGYRFAMMQYSQNHSVTSTAEEFDTTRKTVRNWKKRFDETIKSLDDYSKRPHNIQNIVPVSVLDKIKKECEILKSHSKKIVGSYLIRDFKLPFTLPTINKYLGILGFKKKKQSKKERKRNLYELKKKYKSFEKIQIDIKYLDDIPEFYHEYYTYGLPKYQITARCVKSGALFIGYAREKTNLNTSIFIYRLLTHLQDHDIDITKTTIQTDNGREFRNLDGQKSTMFLYILEKLSVNYYHIPAGAKTWQSDVETSHRLIEDEFYAYRIFNNASDFFLKAEIYQNDFNTNRVNSYKENQTPSDIVLDDMIGGYINFDDTDWIDVDSIFKFKPVVVDKLTSKFLKVI